MICVKVCEKEKTCAAPAQEGRDCYHYCTRRGADASVLGLGSPGVSSSCNSAPAFARINVCMNRDCYDFDNCVTCACGATWLYCPYAWGADGG
jgi:hypothetical protein